MKRRVRSLLECWRQTENAQPQQAHEGVSDTVRQIGRRRQSMSEAAPARSAVHPGPPKSLATWYGCRYPGVLSENDRERTFCDRVILHAAPRGPAVCRCSRSEEMMPGCLQHLTGLGHMEFFDKQVIGIEGGNGKDGDACCSQRGDQRGQDTR